MKFEVIRTSDPWASRDNPDILEINSLDELLEFVKKEDCEIIIGFNESDPIQFRLEIYDDNRE